MMGFVRHNMTTLSLFSIWLVFNLDLTRVHARSPPQTYTLKNERVEQDTAPVVGRSFRENDILLSYIDAPWSLFPCKVVKMQVWWQLPDETKYHYPVMVVPLLYDANGYLRYESDIAVLSPYGLNEIPMTRMWGTAPNYPESFLTPPIFDANETKTPDGLYAGFQIVGHLETPMTDYSGNLVCSNAGAWQGFNLLGRNGQWYDLQAEGLPGNLVIRVEIEPLCPAKIGDMPVWNGYTFVWDGVVDNQDRAILQSMINVGGDIFNDYRIYMDLNNDGVLDSADMDILNANFTGTGNVVIPQKIEIVTPSIGITAQTGKLSPGKTLQVRNSGGGTLNFQVESTVPWIGVSPNSSTSSGETKNITLTFNAQGFSPGVYSAWVRVDANAANSPQFVPVTATVRTVGDFNNDGNVDSTDLAIFQACGTGPAIHYAGALPPGCTLVPNANGFIAADFDRDGDVDQDDFASLQLRYGTPANAAEFPNDFATLLQVDGAPSNIVVATAPSTIEHPRSSIDPTLQQIPQQLLSTNPVQLNNPDGSIVKTSETPDTARKAPTLDTGIRPRIGLGLVFGLAVLIIGLAYLGYLLWNFFKSGSFFTNARPPNSSETLRIQQAIDLLNTINHPDARRAYQTLSNAYYFPDSAGGIVINTQEQKERSTQASVLLGTIGIRQNFVNPPVWNYDSTRMLALILWAEWQHIDKPQYSETQCFEWFENFTRAIGWTDLHVPYQHGLNERKEG